MRSRNGASGSGNEARMVNARMALTLSDPTGCLRPLGWIGAAGMRPPHGG